MISIVIPVYNYDVRPLVASLVEMGNRSSRPYEIIVQDDASNEFHQENEELNNLANVQYYRSENNQGRTATRALLAERARYDWLLYLDADVLPVEEHFLQNYLAFLDSEYELVMGGLRYTSQLPNPNVSLRWNYGTSREAITAQQRTMNPYFIVSPNLLVRKKLMQESNPSMGNKYGMDLLFSYRLFKRKARVLHIDNPVYHIGLEPDDVYLGKSLRAIENLVAMEKEGLISDDFTSLQKTYKKFKNIGFLAILNTFTRLFKKSLQKNLYNGKPNLRLFDLYRLEHYSRLKK